MQSAWDRIWATALGSIFVSWSLMLLYCLAAWVLIWWLLAGMTAR